MPAGPGTPPTPPAGARQAHVLRANLANSATCAFVYPSCVDGRTAHRAYPLADDQDWALVYAVSLGLDRPL